MILLAGVLATPTGISGQDGTECSAPLHTDGGARPQWTGDSIVRGGSKPTAKDVRRLLAGEYDLQQIPTHGVPRRTAWRWRLVLAPPATDSVVRCPLGPCRRAIPLIGAVLPRNNRLGTDEISRGNVPYEQSVQVVYSDSLQTVTLSLQPRTLDGGTIFYVLAISPYTFSGIWIDGGAGINGIPLRLNGIRVFEPLQGYFCAFRRRSR